MDLIERVGFDVSFSFIYSARPGTPAAALADDTPESLKKQRLQHLQADSAYSGRGHCRRDGGHAPTAAGNGFCEERSDG